MKEEVVSMMLVLAAVASGCSVKSAAVGIAPDAMDQIVLGMDRSNVEHIVGANKLEEQCKAGSRIYYVYDRGQPSRGAKEVIGLALVDALTMGFTEIGGACEILCQKGIVEMIYDRDGKVAAVRPHPDAYDVGFYCGARSEDVPIGMPVWLSGDLGEICQWTRTQARQTDRAKKIEAPDDIIAEIGCDKTS